MGIAKFEYKGNIYDYEGVCKFKLDHSWIDAVMYSRDGHMYVRELLDFIVKFKCVEAKNPIPGDEWLKKDKTAADIAGDFLGDGYAPGYGEGEIPAEEVESCDTLSKDKVKPNKEYFKREL